MKRIGAVFATEPFADDPVDFPALATGAKTTAVFPTVSHQEQPGRILSPDQGFKRF